MAAWRTAMEEAFVRNMNRKVGRRDRQFATGLAAGAGKERLRLLAKRADRRE
jgi:hypothetical protein